VIAALVGKTHIKEEIVHGSYRVAASLSSLVNLDLDVRSTAAYGLAHIFAALTVSNHELRKRALAEKDMTPEQYETLSKLQRIKTKDEDGNEIEEKGEPDDPDTYDLVRIRIQRIAASDGIKLLVKLVSEGSAQTREKAAEALAQMCVEETCRGAMTQQGALKACQSVGVDMDIAAPTRRQAAHCVAKILVTTNPMLLTEHQRMGAIRALLLLCADVKATDLQQFEGLLSLTNLVSSGEVEQDRFVSEKGVGTVHYLMFSDHLMVRRAAAECLCNLSSNEGVLKMLRHGEKARLWLGFSEEWDKEIDDEDEDAEKLDESKDNSDGNASKASTGNQKNLNPADDMEAHMARLMKVSETEPFKTARACAGTLAVATFDPSVCAAIVNEKCASTVVSLLESAHPELVHRALVMVSQLCGTLGHTAAKHLVDGGVVPAIGVVARLGNAQLGEIAKAAAQALSKAMKAEPETADTDTSGKPVNRVEEL
jgi:hypothetical protein